MRKRDYIRWLEGRLEAALTIHLCQDGICPACRVPYPCPTAAALATQHTEDRP